ncbi:DNA damage-regulated autophagy modulator protein 2-like [Zophobas morio]|uniref:DNA damage-regulated autophagy modulator protein 2-like n=1 Tax=Zophobas morio TaxID=2755281 RepID=UPI00308319B3
MTLRLRFHLHYWPILTAVWISLAFIICYLVAIFDQHVHPLFPYISDTGALPPESCIFGQMLNIAACLMFITMYIRFRTVQLLEHVGFSKNYKFWNKFSNIFGFFSCLGISLVANFQETSEITVHFIGAFLAFAVGAVYCIIQAYLTWLSFSSKRLKLIRILLSLLLIPLYITTTVCSALSFKEFNENAFKWKHTDKGYTLHLFATFTEWIMAVLMILYMATFYVEFRLVKFGGLTFVLEDDK